MSNLHQLRSLLCDETGRTLTELARSLQLSERHIQRMLNELKETGEHLAVMKDGRTKRWFIPPEHRRLPEHNISLTEEQIFALAVSAEASRAGLSGTSLGEPLAQALDRLFAAYDGEIMTFEPESLGLYFGSAAAVNFEPGTFRLLLGAIRECRTVRMDYFTASSQSHSAGRRLDPYLIFVRGNTWMVTGKCHRSLTVKDFALPRISAVALTGEVFTRTDFNPDIYFQGRFGAIAGGELVHVRVQFEAACAHLFREKRYHPSQQIEETRPDGSVVVAYTVQGLDEIRSWIQSWGTLATVLGPEEMITEIRKVAGVLGGRYGGR